LQGVAVHYLEALLVRLHHSHGSSINRMTTSQFCQMYIRPFTSHSHTSFLDVLASEGNEGLTGEASWFISHTWTNPVVDTLEAVCAELLDESKGSRANAFVWFDVMATPQYETEGPSKPSSWWMTTFKDSIAHIGGLLLVVDAWDNPTALQRAW